MAKRKTKRPEDVNQLARHLVGESTDQSEDIEAPTKAQISVFMAKLGRKGGKIGGKRRLQTMSSDERKRIARKAAIARWSNVSRDKL
jgi:hypothetical protein